MSKRMVLVVAAALFDSHGKILLAQRPPGKSMAGLWEFPGGKIEDGETPETALVRELAEELGVKVNKGALKSLNFVSHDYSDFHLLMVLYACHEWFGDVRPAEGQEFAWVYPDELQNYDAPAADIPLFEYLATGTN